jgi:hypothetical protein
VRNTRFAKQRFDIMAPLARATLQVDAAPQAHCDVLRAVRGELCFQPTADRLNRLMADCSDEVLSLTRSFDRENSEAAKLSRQLRDFTERAEHSSSKALASCLPVTHNTCYNG